MGELARESRDVRVRSIRRVRLENAVDVLCALEREARDRREKDRLSNLAFSLGKLAERLERDG